MGRYRTIQCLVWQDDKFPFIGDDLQLMWFHLMTTPLSTPLGIFYAPIAGLASEKEWNEDRYRKRLLEGSTKGFWKVDERSKVVYLPKFFRYHRPDNPNILRGWLKCWDEVPECSLKDECYHELKKYCEEWGEGFKKVFETLPKRLANLPETVTVTVTGTVTVEECGAGSDKKQSLPARTPSTAFLKIPLIDKSEYELMESQIDQWKEIYPSIDIEQQCRAYLGWAIANPKKRKKREGILRSINSWLTDKQSDPKYHSRRNPDVKESAVNTSYVCDYCNNTGRILVASIKNRIIAISAYDPEKENNWEGNTKTYRCACAAGNEFTDLEIWNGE